MDEDEDEESQKSEESLKPEILEEIEVIDEVPEEEVKKPKIQLDEVCNVENLVDLKVRFDGALWNVLDRNGLRKCLKEVIDVEFDDDEFNIMFLKVPTITYCKFNVPWWKELTSANVKMFIL